MRFHGINTLFFDNYLDALKYFPKAICHLKSGFYTVREVYCWDIIAGWFWNPFFIMGLSFIAASALPFWSILIWLALNLILFHPDITIF